jgi:hypothetical protein
VPNPTGGATAPRRSLGATIDALVDDVVLLDAEECSSERYPL